MDQERNEEGRRQKAEKDLPEKPGNFFLHSAFFLLP